MHSGCNFARARELVSGEEVSWAGGTNGMTRLISVGHPMANAVHHVKSGCPRPPRRSRPVKTIIRDATVVLPGSSVVTNVVIEDAKIAAIDAAAHTTAD